MSKNLNTRIFYFFVAIFIITNLGFYKTYLVHFPTVEGFAWVYHLHDMLAMAWIFMDAHCSSLFDSCQKI